MREIRGDLRMVREPISPELALIDPALAFRATEEALPTMISHESTNGSLPATNGSADALADNQVSVEALLFKSGAISADQLGELVRDSVLTQRPVVAIALERGLTTAEALAALQPNGAVAAARAGAPEAPPASPSTPPAAMFQAVPAPAVPTPTLQPIAAELEFAPSVLHPAPLASLDERVQAAVANAAQTDPLTATQPREEPTVAGQATSVEAAPQASFALFVRLQNGEKLAVDSTETFEDAVEQAKSLAGRFSRAGEWPLIAGRCIRPECVVSIDIERALEG